MAPAPETRDRSPCRAQVPPGPIQCLATAMAVRPLSTYLFQGLPWQKSNCMI